VNSVASPLSSIASPSAVRPKPRAPRGRSAVTNGHRLHVVRPGDTAWARRFRDVLANILSEVAAVKGVAVADLPESDKQRARRCATIIVSCEKLEGEAAAGGNIDHKVYSLLSGQLGRNFDRLGLKQNQSRAAAPAPGPLGPALCKGLK
jgi:hypothetical protein